ncbi:MAG: porphobilinogen synthase [Verrucomicrobiota bacterium]
MNLPCRPRRNRANSTIRSLVSETTVGVTDLVQPLFLLEDPNARESIDSLPGIERLGLEPMKRHCETLQRSGIGGVALFPVFPSSVKDAQGSVALDADNYFYKALEALKDTFPDLVFFVDVALDPYTDHGHDGLLDAGGNIDNDLTVERLCAISVLLAQTGVDYVAPSDMMDGRIAAIRGELDSQNYQTTGIMAYSAKFASACYGPFRDAVGSAQSKGYLDKMSYQLNPSNGREASRELALDENEAADIVMVKPAGWYADIIYRGRSLVSVPIAAYQVSGEYSMILASADRGWIDRDSAVSESLTAIKRAGADLIFSYFALEFASKRGK